MLNDLLYFSLSHLYFLDIHSLWIWKAACRIGADKLIFCIIWKQHWDSLTQTWLKTWKAEGNAVIYAAVPSFTPSDYLSLKTSHSYLCKIEPAHIILLFLSLQKVSLSSLFSLKLWSSKYGSEIGKCLFLNVMCSCLELSLVQHCWACTLHQVPLGAGVANLTEKLSLFSD